MQTSTETRSTHQELTQGALVPLVKSIFIIMHIQNFLAPLQGLPLIVDQTIHDGLVIATFHSIKNQHQVVGQDLKCRNRSRNATSRFWNLSTGFQPAGQDDVQNPLEITLNERCPANVWICDGFAREVAIVDDGNLHDHHNRVTILSCVYFPFSPCPQPRCFGRQHNEKRPSWSCLP